jgi:hypothetical protein
MTTQEDRSGLPVWRPPIKNPIGLEISMRDA